MADPTVAELAGRVAAIETRLGMTPPTPTPTPAPAPAPAPAGAVPAAPTGLHVTMLPDQRPQLDWDPAADATSWDVLDLLDTVTPVKETVTTPRSVRSALKAGARRRYSVRARNAAGVSPLSAALDVPAAAVPTPTPAPATAGKAPGSVLDLSHWYLTLPIADPTGKDTSGPWDVYQPDLATFVHPDFFRTGVDAHGPYVEYIVPAKGVSTSGSEAARAELRQMSGPKPSDKASFAPDDGKPHRLTCTLTCDGTSIVGRKEVITGQIHGPGGTPPIILCVNHTRGALEVFRQGPRQGDLLTDLQPGELFTYSIVADEHGVGLWACRGGADALPTAAAFAFPLTSFTERAGWYFKGGAYLKQPAATATTGQAIVRHYRLDLT